MVYQLISLFQEITQVQVDFLPDTFSAELISLVILERVWSKVKAWLEEKSLDKRLDKMGERIARLEGKTSK